MCDCREGGKCVEGKKGCVKLTETLSMGSETRLNGVAENRQVDLTEEIGEDVCLSQRKIEKGTEK